MVSNAGCKNVETVLADFLQINPFDKEYQNVEYILVDPSCSGSGIIDRLDLNEDDNDTDDTSESRLQVLSSFQKKVVSHAMKCKKKKESLL